MKVLVGQNLLPDSAALTYAAALRHGDCANCDRSDRRVRIEDKSADFGECRVSVQFEVRPTWSLLVCGWAFIPALERQPARAETGQRRQCEEQNDPYQTSLQTDCSV